MNTLFFRYLTRMLNRTFTQSLRKRQGSMNKTRIDFLHHRHSCFRLYYENDLRTGFMLIRLGYYRYNRHVIHLSIFSRFYVITYIQFLSVENKIRKWLVHKNCDDARSIRKCLTIKTSISPAIL